MAEKNFYGSSGQFKGSMDDDGRIYDERHRFMGYVKGGRIYDNCNIPHGRITGSGMVVDNRMHEVGQEFGTGFCSPASGPRRQMGLTRADVLSDGRGRDYGRSTCSTATSATSTIPLRTAMTKKRKKKTTIGRAIPPRNQYPLTREAGTDRGTLKAIWKRTLADALTPWEGV